LKRQIPRAEYWKYLQNEKTLDFLRFKEHLLKPVQLLLSSGEAYEEQDTLDWLQVTAWKVSKNLNSSVSAWNNASQWELGGVAVGPQRRKIKLLHFERKGNFL